MASPRKPSALAVLERSATSMLREHEEMLREHEAQEMEALDAELAQLEAKSATLVDDFNSTTKNLDAADEYSRQRLDSAANLLEEQAAKLRAKSIANLDAQIAAYEARVAKGEMYDSSKGEVIDAKVTTLKRELTRMKSSGKAGTQPTGPSRSLLFVLGVVVFALAAIFVGGAQGQPAVEVKAKGKPMKPVKAKKR